MEHSPLFMLPAELRNDIYRLVLVSDKKIRVETPGAINPPLLLTCREVRNEAITIYYEENLFRVPVHNFNPDLCIKFENLAGSLGRQHRMRIRFGPNVYLNVNRDSWSNLLRWLKLYHEGIADNRFVAPSQTGLETSRDMMLIGTMFEVVPRFRSQPWDTIEKMIKELYVVLQAISPQWAQDV